MPIAVKLSRKFYDAFGDEVVNELVEVLNQVDLAYRGTLHELNEASFGRLDERFARVDERFARFDERFTRFDERLARFGDELRAETNAGLAGVRAEMQAGFAKADAKLEQQIAAVRAEMQAGFAKTDTTIANLRGELVKWMFLFWAGTALPVVGLLRF